MPIIQPAEAVFYRPGRTGPRLKLNDVFAVEYRLVRQTKEITDTFNGPTVPLLLSCTGAIFCRDPDQLEAIVDLYSYGQAVNIDLIVQYRLNGQLREKTFVNPVLGAGGYTYWNTQRELVPAGTAPLQILPFIIATSRNMRVADFIKNTVVAEAA